MEPITATVSAFITQYKVWSGLFGKWKAERKEQLAGMAMADVELIDDYVEQGKFKELMDAYRNKSGWPQTDAREYLNLVIDTIMAQEPQLLLEAEPMSWDVFQQKISYGLRGSTEITTKEIPSVSSGDTKEVVKQQAISTTAKEISTSPLFLIQKYWYLIPIILIPLYLLYCKKKGNPCRFK